MKIVWKFSVCSSVSVSNYFNRIIDSLFRVFAYTLIQILPMLSCIKPMLMCIPFLWIMTTKPDIYLQREIFYSYLSWKNNYVFPYIYHYI